MPHLSLRLLGPFQASLDDQPLTGFRSVKNQALLAYLALDADRAHARAALADLLWPEEPEAKARLNLRQALFQLRNLLQPPPVAEAAEFLLITPQTVQFNRQTQQTLDARDFAQLIDACQAHHHFSATPAADQRRCPLCLHRLQQAVELYRGEFLAELFVENSPDLEEWIRWQRQHSEVRVLESLATLALGCEQNQDYINAYQYALRQIKLDPLREEGQRQVIRLLALRGQTEAAIAHYDRLRRLLRKELNTEPAPETVELIKQIRRGKQGDRQIGRQGDRETGGLGKPFLPIVSLPLPVIHNLPGQLTALVGREREVAEIYGRLAPPSAARLLTIVGAGGMGKTKLALAVGQAFLDVGAPAMDSVADTLADQSKAQGAKPLYPDGIFYVTLAALSDAGAIAPALAATVGLNVQGDPPAAVLRWVRDKRLLLILDNFEHLLAGAGFVVELLQAAPALQILVTSRERLNVRGEHLYPIRPLAYEPGQTGVKAVAALPSVQLFLQSAQRTQPNFALDAENSAVVLRICRLLQGMPLGLELAAAWVGTLSLVEIANAITQKGDLLASHWRDAPERQQSLRAVFEWSWQLLTAEEQRVLGQLTVFHGGFTHAAAQAVTGATVLVLTRLVHKSLVQWEEGDLTTTGGRYTLHELLRQFAAEKLALAPREQTTVQTMHSHFYLAFVAARALRLVRREPQVAGAEIQHELDNIRQAWAWAAEQGEIAALTQAAQGWWQFCLWQGLGAEGRQTFALAIQGVRAWLVGVGQRGDEPAIQAGRRLLSELLAIHANFLFAQGQDEQMAAEAREAIALGQANGSIEGEALGHFVLGRAYQEFEQLDNAIAMWQKTIALAHLDQQSPTPSEMVREAEWMAHAWLRGAWLALEAYAASRAEMVQALQICQTLGHVRGELACLSNLAWSDFFVGDYAVAQQRFEQGFQLACTLGNRWTEMSTCMGLGEVMRLQGHYTQALHLLTRSITIAIEDGHTYNEVMVAALLVRLHSYLGDQTGAEAWCSRLFQLLQRTKLPKDCQRQGLLAAAVKAHYAGATQTALAYAEQARQLTGPGDILNHQADALVILGHTQVGMAQLAAAVESYQVASAYYTKMGNRAAATEAQAGLAQVALLQGAPDHAQRWVDAILPILIAQPRAGFTTPFFTYLTCYRVLVANQDPRAQPLLQQGRALLQHDAQQIDDARLRAAFLEKVAVHVELQAR